MSKPSDEKQRIENIVAPMFSTPSKSFEVSTGAVRLQVDSGKGDDCAVLDFNGNLSLVAGSDYVRGPKFALFEEGLLDYYDIGYYLVVANISDIAAMGALPVGLLTIVRYTHEMSDDDFKSIMAGISDAAKRYDTTVIGGDIGGAERVILSASAIGICETGKYLLRSRAEVGDLVCVTGPVGTPGAAVIYFTALKKSGKGLSSELEQEMLTSWKRPTAKIREGRLLSTSGIGRACQDVSDGLKATLEELAQLSNKGITIEEDKVPFTQSVRSVAELINVDPIALACSASVDFELVFTIDPDDRERCERLFDESSLSFHVIGQVTEDKSNYIRRRNGELQSLPGVSWRHQAGNVADNVMKGLNK